MEILSLRDESRGDSTAAYVSVDGVHECHSIEDVVRKINGEPVSVENVKGVPVSEWKVDALTAIPEGRYPVTIDMSPRFKRRMIHIHKVPGFTGIRAHSGRDPKHSEGCVILGDELHEEAAGWRVRDGASKPAVDRLFAKIDEALASGEPVWWTFKTNPAIAEARA